MKLPPLKLTFDYSDTPERRAVSLEKDGILCVPVIGYDKYRKVWSGPTCIATRIALSCRCACGEAWISSSGEAYGSCCRATWRYPGLTISTGSVPIPSI